jgi:hypothetical protein
LKIEIFCGNSPNRICGVNDFSINLNQAINGLGKISNLISWKQLFTVNFLFNYRHTLIFNFPSIGLHKFFELSIITFFNYKIKVLYLHECNSLFHSAGHLRKLIYKTAFKRYTLILVPDNVIQKELTQNFNINSIVMPIYSNILEVDNFELKDKVCIFDFCAFGRLSTTKILFLIEIITFNKYIFYNKTLVLLGSKEFNEDSIKLLIELLDSINCRVIFKFNLVDLDVFECLSKTKYGVSLINEPTDRNASILAMFRAFCIPLVLNKAELASEEFNSCIVELNKFSYINEKIIYKNIRHINTCRTPQVLSKSILDLLIQYK